MAVFFGITISVLSIYFPRTIQIGILFGGISELTSLFTYYTFEHFWRKHIEHNNIKKGMNILLLKEGGDRHSWYEVIEVLEENKIVIKVV